MLVPFVKLTKSMTNICKRDLGIFAPAMQKGSDPIQQLFLDKIREFRSKYKDGALLPPESEEELKKLKLKILSQYNFKSEEEVQQIPSFKFPEPTIEKVKYPKSA